MDALEEVLGTQFPYEQGRQTWRWQDPWVGVLCDSDGLTLPEVDAMAPVFEELSWMKLQQIVAFGSSEAPDAVAHWWAPEVSTAIMGHPQGLRVSGRMLEALAAGSASECEVDDVSLVRSVVALGVRLSTRRGWEGKHGAGRFELSPAEGAPMQLHYARGRIVSGGPDREASLHAARALLSTEHGRLRWSLEPAEGDVTIALDEALSG